MKTFPFEITSEHTDNTDLHGTITLKRANAFEIVQIAARASDIANGNLNQVDFVASQLAYSIATLELLTQNAPKGFMEDVKGKPELNPGLLEDTVPLFAVYQGYQEWVAKFRPGARGAIEGTPGNDGTLDLERSESDQSKPA